MGSRETCGDYERYVYMYEVLEGDSLAKNVAKTESLYGFFNWLSAQLQWKIYGVNTLCAAVFLGCIGYCALKEPLPLFFSSLCVPYFVIVVGMGYTRQGVAAALIMLALQSLREGRPWRYAMQIVLAAGFHASSFAALPAVLFGKLNYRSPGTKFVVRAVVIGLGAAGFYGVLREQYSTYIQNYVQSERYSSGGALLRSLVTGAAAIVLYRNRREWNQQFGDLSGLMPFAVVGFLTMPLSLIASTPADRLGLYLLPFQLIVFGRLPSLKSKRAASNQYQIAIGAAYVLYFYVWLHLGTYSRELWVPYKSALF